MDDSDYTVDGDIFGFESGVKELKSNVEKVNEDSGDAVVN